MIALVKQKIGAGNVELAEMTPQKPNPDQVVIQVKAVGICGTDLHIQSDDSYPVVPPVILGHELSGVITEIGSEVTGLEIGQRVVSETYYHTCGNCVYCNSGHKNLCEEKRSIGGAAHGAMAEFVVVPGKNIHKIPDHLSFEEGAMLEPLACCTQAVFEFANLEPNDYVLVMGPGTIGLLTLQVIVQFGCKVIMVGTKADQSRLEMAEKLGAAKTFYADDPELNQKLKDYCGGIGPNCAFDCSGNGIGINTALKALRKGGEYVQIGLPSKPVEVDLSQLALRELSIAGSYAQKPIWWVKSLELLCEGKIQLKPLISTVRPLAEWEISFDDARCGRGFKHLLTP